MLGCWRILIIALALVVGGQASAQDNRGYIGIDSADITAEEAKALGWETPRGIRVVRSRDDGPAKAAGIQPGDIIVMLDGQEVESMQGFLASVGAKGAGQQVRLR